MALIEEFTKTGNWLFRWRSYLPVVLISLVMFSMYLNRAALLPGNWQWATICLFISAVGEGIRIFVVAHSASRTSGRNVKRQIAESLNTTGAYSLIRHPLYFANFLMWIGLGLFTRMWWVNVVFCLCYWLYYERIMFAEESFLRGKFGDDYIRYAEKIPSFLPLRWNNWQPSSIPFNWRKVLRKEQSSFYAMIISFVILEIYRNFLIYNKLCLSRNWLIFFAIGTVLYLFLQFLKKGTKLLFMSIL